MPVYAASSPWNQSDWSGGSGQTSWSVTNKFSASSNINSSTPGEFNLSSVGDWYNASWTYRKKITIDHNKVSSDLTDFPMLVSLSTDSQLQANALSNGNDILFTSSNGTTKLDHEIEKYDSSNGNLIAWVRIPTLSSTVDTEIYLYYGNSSASSQQNKTGVWVNFAAVYHLAESSGAQTDSTSNGLNTTSLSLTQQGANVGIVDGADQFNGTNNVVTISDNAAQTPANDMTLEAWFKPTQLNVVQTLVRKAHSSSPFHSYYLDLEANNGFCFAWYNSSATQATRCDGANNVTTTGVWYYGAATRNGTNPLTMYVNGVDRSSYNGGNPSGTLLDGASNFYIGAGNASSTLFAGYEDEVRLSTISRPAAYFSTTYNTISSPSTFSTLGSAQTNSGASGTLTSSIFDAGSATDWGILTYTATTPTNTSVSVKIRTGNSPTLSDATAFSSCTAISSSSDISSNSCIHDQNRYVQYQIVLANTDNTSNPSFQDLNLTFSPTAAPSSSNFVQRVGSNLYLNSSIFKFSGTNIYYLGLDENVGGTDYPTKFRIDNVLSTAKELGTNVVRTFGVASVGCSKCIEPSLNTFNDDGFQYIDYAIQSASNKGIRLVLPLVDNWHYYHGGKHTFTDWRSVSEDSFYSNSTVISDYKAYISHILNHVNVYTGIAYKDDPTILAWETGNELTISSGSWPSSWTQNIADYIKSIDSNHLVSDGHVESSALSSTLDTTSLTYSSVDMYSAHHYPPNVSTLTTDASTVSSYNKVFWVGEYNWSGSTGGDGLDDYFTAIENNSVSGDAFWSLFGHLDTYGYEQHNEVYTLHYPGDTSDMATRAQKIRNHAYRMRSLSVPGNLTISAPLLHTPVTALTGISLLWTGSVGATSYNIERSTDGRTWLQITTGITDNNTPWIDTSANINQNYFYRIQGVNLSGEKGDYSNIVSYKGNQVQNPSFEYSDIYGPFPFWTFQVQGGASATFSRDSSTAGTGNVSGAITTTATGGSQYNVKALTSNFSLIANKTYTISYKAKADASRSIYVAFQQAASPYTVHTSQTPNLTTSWQSFSFSYTPNASDYPDYLTFSTAQSTGTVWLDDICVNDGSGCIPPSLPASPNNSTNSSPSAPSCDNPTPGSKSIWLYGALPQNGNTIMLNWTDAQAPYDHYVLEYGLQSGNYIYGSDNIGGIGNRSFAVGSLTPNTKYYFRVRAGNGCAPGAWSNEISATTKSLVSTNQLVFTSSQLTPSTETESTTETKTNNSSCEANYTVKPGDTLWSIASTNLGSGASYKEIIELNKDEYPSLEDSNNLRTGWKLKLSCEEEEQTKTEEKNDDNTTESGQGGYELNITVTDENKKPVEGAKVTVHSKVQEAVTNKDGIAEFKNVEQGQHQVLIAYDNYEGQQSINLTGDVKKFDLAVSVQPKNVLLSPLVIAIISILLVVIGGLIFALVKARKTKNLNIT